MEYPKTMQRKDSNKTVEVDIYMNRMNLKCLKCLLRLKLDSAESLV